MISLNFFLVLVPKIFAFLLGCVCVVARYASCRDHLVWCAMNTLVLSSDYSYREENMPKTE